METHRKGPSPAFVLVMVVTVVGLAFSFTLPRLVLPRFVNQPVMLVLQVHVTDEKGAAVPSANVFVGKRSARTDADGYANLRQLFRGKGIMGITGTCTLEGEMRVEATGFTSSHVRLPDLLGREYDYVARGTTVPCEITLRP